MARILAGCWLMLAAGCVVVDVGVKNPIPGLTTVAVVPFFNLSQEPAVDGRQFAMAYFAELQKVPGFQVLPVGVTEQAMFDHGLDMESPADALKLAKILKVDAVVVGAVTDYDTYYPPRIGLQVSWYSPRPWSFDPGMPVDPSARRSWVEAYTPRPLRALFGMGCGLAKGKASDSETIGTDETLPPETGPGSDGERSSASDANNPPMPSVPGVESSAGDSGIRPTGAIAALSDGPEATTADALVAVTAPVAEAEFDPQKPLMSYTRIFDGTDAAVVAALRDQVALSGDRRSGGWEGHLHRSEDFIRFSCRRMIAEMLMLHGGEARRRFVFTWPIRQ